MEKVFESLREHVIETIKKMKFSTNEQQESCENSIML